MDAPTLMGLVWMIVLGPAVGNYACSVVYRLPRGQTPFERHPYCGHCNAALQPKDLFPILSWLSTRGKCRYCGGAVPGVYTVIELACLALFVGNFLRFGMGESFLLVTGFGVFSVILAAIQWQQGWISSSIYGFALTFAALHRTLVEVTIYGWVKEYVVVMVMGLLVARADSVLRGLPFAPFATPWLWWAGLFAALVPLSLPAMLLMVLGLFLLGFNRYAAPLFGLVALLLPLV